MLLHLLQLVLVLSECVLSSSSLVFFRALVALFVFLKAVKDSDAAVQVLSNLPIFYFLLSFLLLVL